MAKKAKAKQTGEIVRSFIKHKVYGTVYAIEGDETGTVLASAVVTEATACRHTLPAYELTLDDVDRVNIDIRDYEVFEPVCSDPKHLLDEIGLLDRAVSTAEAELVGAGVAMKQAREAVKGAKAKLWAMVREATNPVPLPLFDAKPEATPPAAVPDIPEGCYRDGVGVVRCSTCFAAHPCGLDHTAPPASPAPPTDQPSA